MLMPTLFVEQVVADDPVSHFPTTERLKTDAARRVSSVIPMHGYRTFHFAFCILFAFSLAFSSLPIFPSSHVCLLHMVNGFQITKQAPMRIRAVDVYGRWESIDTSFWPRAICIIRLVLWILSVHSLLTMNIVNESPEEYAI